MSTDQITGVWELATAWRERIDATALSRPVAPLTWMALGLLAGKVGRLEVPRVTLDELASTLLVGATEAQWCVEELARRGLIVQPRK